MCGGDLYRRESARIRYDTHSYTPPEPKIYTGAAPQVYSVTRSYAGRSMTPEYRTRF